MDAHEPIEEWRAIEGTPNYEVSDRGRVRRTTPAKHTRVGRVLKPWFSSDGYALVDIEHATTRIGPLVCRAFHGPKPSPKHEVRHLNGKPADDRASNLAWGTHAENVEDTRRHGTMATGEKNGRARLTDAEVAAVRREYALACEGRWRAPAGWRMAAAERYGVCSRQIWMIVKDRSRRSPASTG